jgi:hypothetical protein
VLALHRNKERIFTADRILRGGDVDQRGYREADEKIKYQPLSAPLRSI